MIARRKHYAAALALGAVIAAAGHAVAQDGLIREEQLQNLSVELSGIASRVQESVSTTMATMESFASLSSDDQRAQTLRTFAAMEGDIRAMMELVNITSPFMSALDDARANVVVMLRREEREAPGAERDARFAEITHALAAIDDQMRQMRAVEATLVAMLDELREGDTLPDILPVLSEVAALLSVAPEESCSAASVPLRSSTSDADDAIQPQVPCCGDVQSCSTSAGVDGPAASPNLHDIRNPE